MSALPEPFLTEDEYLAIEQTAGFKSEYIDGEMYAMAGAGEQHNAIINNVSFAFNRQLSDRSCRVYSSDMRVRVADSGLYAYPDVTVLCGKPEVARDKGDSLLNPQLIVEVLSPGTAHFDRTDKFRRYQQISSFADYVLVWQNQFRVEHRQRREDAPQEWETFNYFQLGDRLYFPALETFLEMADIYRNVEFTPGPLPPFR